MEQLHADWTTDPAETERREIAQQTAARSQWSTLAITMLSLVLFAGIIAHMLTPQAQQPSSLVVVTRNVCQPTPLPTGGSAIAPYQTVP